jgi:uncharacterized protein involved in exopolysaccharide biosynthesis
MNPTEATRRPAALPVERARDAERRHVPDQLSVLRIVNTLLRHRATVVATALLFGAAVASVTLLKPRTYSASASFVAQGRSGASGLSGLAAQIGLAVPVAEGAQSPQFYLDLIQSREILRDVVDSNYAVPTDTGLARGTLADFFAVSEPTAALRREAAMDRLRSRLTAALSPKTGVVTYRVTTQYASLTHQISERIVTLLNRFNLQTRQSQAAAERKFTSQRLDEAAQELRLAENRLLMFLQRNRQFANSPELRFEEDRLSREVALRQQIYTTVAQAFEQAKIDEVRDTPVITVIERPEVPVRPDRRHVVQKVAIGLVVGLLVGIAAVLTRHLLPGAAGASDDDAAEFAALRRAAVDDLTHPWRPVARLFRGRQVASY